MARQHTTNNGNEIEEALDFLTQTAKERGDELKSLIAEKYSDLKDVLTVEASGPRLEQSIERIQDILEQGEKLAKKAFKKADQQIQKTPWTFLAAVAAGCFLVGLMTGKCNHSRSRNRGREGGEEEIPII